MTDPAHPHGHDAPDRYTRWGEDATAWVEMHWQRAVGAVVLLVVMGAGWAWYDHSRSQLLSAARAKVAEIAAQFPGPGDDVPEPAIRTALSRYETFLETAPKDTTPYWMARLNAAQAHEALGEVDEARAAYEAVMKGPAVFAGPARMRLGYLAAAQGDGKAAGTAFANVVDRYPGLAPQAALEQGRLAEAADQKDVAIAAYQLLAENFRDTPQASEAEARLKALGVTPEPAPAPEFAPAPAAEGDAAAPAPEGEAKGPDTDETPPEPAPAPNAP